MGVNRQGTLLQIVVDEVRRRYEMRGAVREITESEIAKLQTVVDEASHQVVISGCKSPHALMSMFLDHFMPSGESFSPLKNVYFVWRDFLSSRVPHLVDAWLHLDDEMEMRLGKFLEDWKELTKDVRFYRPFYCEPNRVGAVKVARLYRNSSAYYDLVSLLVNLREQSIEKFPLFTLRGFLAAQIESLAGFIDRLVLGNITSEKALERYEDWYCRRYYSPELVEKAKKRPSDNNPVSHPGTRWEYERGRMSGGYRGGIHLLEGEVAVLEVTTPMIYTETIVRDMKPVGVGGVGFVPSNMRESVGGQSSESQTRSS